MIAATAFWATSITINSAAIPAPFSEAADGMELVAKAEPALGTELKSVPGEVKGWIAVLQQGRFTASRLNVSIAPETPEGGRYAPPAVFGSSMRAVPFRAPCSSVATPTWKISGLLEAVGIALS